MVSCRLTTGRQKPLHLPTKCSCTYLQKRFALFCKKCLQKTFLSPIRVVSRLFRSKYLAELKHLWEDGKLNSTAARSASKTTMRSRNCWTPVIKRVDPLLQKPFDGAESVIKYLGKYTHRIAISNYRIKSMTDSSVTFTAKDYKNQGQWKGVQSPVKNSSAGS